MSSQHLPAKGVRNAGAALTLLAGLSLLAARPAQAQYTLTSFDVGIGGATGTSLLGINNSGHLVGSYVDSSGVTHGFFGTTASQTTVDGPAALSSTTNPFAEVNQINNAGTYVGDFEATDASGTDSPEGFTGSGGTVVPTTLANSAAFGINNLGVSVGTVLSSNGTDFQSYSETGGVVTTFNVPGNATSRATGINDSGVIVGQADMTTTTGPTVSYIKNGNAFTFLSLAGTGAVDNFATDITTAGIIVGAFDTVANGPLTGFVDLGGTLTTITFPSADSTEVDGINGLGEIVGTYTDANGTLHGFLGAPPPVPEASTTVSFGLLLALGLGGMALAAKRKKAHASA